MASKGIIGRLTIFLIILSLNSITIGVSAYNSNTHTAVPESRLFNNPGSADNIETFTPEPIQGDGILISMVNRQFDPLDESPILFSNANSNLLYNEPVEYQLIQFGGPVEEDWIESVEELGVTLLKYIPDYSFIARTPLDKHGAITNVESVRWLGPYHPFYKLDPSLLSTLLLDPSLHKDILGEKANYTVMILDTAEGARNGFKADVEKLGGEFDENDLELALESGMVQISLSPDELEKVSRLPVVEWIQPSAEIITHNLNSAKITGARQSVDGPYKWDSTAMWSFDPATGQFNGYTGSNATVAVVDTGVEGSHPTFKGRLKAFYSYNGAGNWQDGAYHGTHVAGTVLGDGSWRTNDPSPGPAGKYAGIAPNASLVGQAYLGSGRPISTVMRDAVLGGADISTNSWGYWGSYWHGRYEAVSAAYDRLVRDSWEGTPMSVMFSAGNEGPGETTTNPPSTAKNVISVGSCDDNDGKKISGFSARGPTEDGRLKPDILAPGAGITSAFAHSSYSYTTMSGTSMSSPAVAGGAAVVIDYYQQKYEHTPSPALVKAILLNGAEPLPGLSWPDDNQGWGRMNLPNSLLETEQRKFLYYDQLDPLKTNEEVTYVFNVAAEANLKIHLVWTDKEGSPTAAKALVNNLDLVVESPLGDTYLGNQFYLGQSIPGGSADNTNNVEAFAIKSSPIGEWEVTIKGMNVPDGPVDRAQDFALIISGPVWEDMLDISSYALGSVPGPDVFRGEPVKLNASIRNTGTLNFGGSQYVLTDYMPDGTNQKLLVSTLEETAPGSFFNFSFDWIPDVIGTHRMVLTLDPLDAFTEANESNNVVEMYVTVNSFGIRLASLDDELVIDPGGVEELRLQVFNTGTVNDMYLLELQNVPVGWQLYLNRTSVTVPVGSYQNVTLRVSVPENAKAGHFNGISVNAYSNSSVSESSQQDIAVVVSKELKYELDRECIDMDIPPGGSAEYELMVKNTGNTELLLDIITPVSGRSDGVRQLGKLSSGWGISTSIQRLLVPYNTSANFTVRLTSPADSLAGFKESVLITFEVVNIDQGSGIGALERICMLNATVDEFHDFELKMLTTNMETIAGKQKRIKLSVINDGNSWDTFTFQAVVPQNWIYTFSPESITMEPFDTDEFELKLKLPENVPEGNYDIAITALSAGDPAKMSVARAELVLAQNYEITMEIDNPVVVIPVGGTMVLPVALDNLGNGNDTVKLNVNWFENLIIFTNSEVSVPVNGGTDVNVVINVPETFKPGNHTIDFIAVSGDGVTQVTQSILVIITPAYKSPSGSQPEPETNVTDTGLGSKAGEESGLFMKGYYFDFFIFMLIFFVIIIFLFTAMLAIDRKYEKKAEAKSAAAERRALAAASMLGAPGKRVPLIQEVRVVRKPREITIVRKQRTPRRKDGVQRTQIPVIEAEVVKPEEAEVVEQEPAVADEPDEEGEGGPGAGPRTNGGSGGSSFNNPLTSILLVLFIVIAGFGAFSSTELGSTPAAALDFQGNIYNDTVWSENMTLTGHTTVRPGVTLYIMPGVTVKFNSGVQFNIAGTLYANGTANNTITFTSSAGNPWKGIWNRIQFNNTGKGRMNYCTVKWATYGVIFDGKSNSEPVSGVSIENSTFTTNRNGIYLYRYAHNNFFKNNNVSNNGWGYGFYIRYSKFNYFENNTVYANTYNFIVLAGNLKDYYVQYFQNDTNKMEGKPMYYWNDRVDEVVPEDAGFVALVGCTNVTVRNVTIKKGGQGIMLAYTQQSLVENVKVTNSNWGIYLYQSGPDNLISKATANSNAYGLYMHDSYNNIMRDNKLQSNTYNIYINGYNTQRFDHDIDTSNKVDNNKPVVYYVNQVNKTVPSNAGYVGLSECTNITVEGIDSRQNAQGILAAYSSAVKIENVNLYKNYFGIYLYRNTGRVVLANSTVTSNSRGAYVYESDDDIMRRTMFDSNYDAFELYRSQNLRVENCSIVASNRWNLNMYGWSTDGSTAMLLNTSFNPNKVRTVTTNTELTVKWFMNIRTVDDLGNPAPSRVIVKDGMDNVVSDLNISGTLNYIECIGYQQQPGLVKYQYNNYTVEARKDTFGILREINMTYSRNIEFVFNEKPKGILPEWLEFSEDEWLEINLADYFTDVNKLTYSTYVYQYLTVSLNNARSTANVTAPSNWFGSGLVTIRVIDEHGAFIESTARINVTPVNDPPEFVKSVPHIRLTEGTETYKYDIAEHIFDPDKIYGSDTIKWYIEEEDSEAVQVIGENGTGTVMELRITDPEYTGSHKLKLYLEDLAGAVAVTDLWLNITARNDPPVLTECCVNPNPGDTDTEFEFMVTYSDTEGDLPSTVQLVLDSIHYKMTEFNFSDRNVKDGKLYYYRGKIATAGQHNYSFAAADVFGAAGYSTDYSNLYVSAVQKTDGGISGQVKDTRFDLILTGAEVKLFYSGNATPVAGGVTVTDSYGGFRFTGLEPGFYNIEGAADGYYNSKIESLLVQPGETASTGTVIKLKEIPLVHDIPGVDTEITDLEINIYFNGTEPFAGDTISFNGAAVDSDGDNLIFYWDFDDKGPKPVGADTVHTYSNHGMYNITLTVLDSDGNVASLTKTIVVKAKSVEEKITTVIKEEEDSYGNSGYLVAGIIFIALLIMLLPWMVFYQKRRKRARTAARKLKVLKKHMQLKAAAAESAARLMPIPVEAQPVPLQPSPQTLPVLPPISIPVIEAEVAEEPVEAVPEAEGTNETGRTEKHNLSENEELQ